MCSFLAPFYNVTNLISGSSYTTLNLYFMQAALIEMELNLNLKSQDVVIKEMAISMKQKFTMYWKNYYVILSLANVLDPTSKMDFVKFCFKKLYPNNYEEKVKQVKDNLYNLFNTYKNNMVASNSSLVNSSRNTLSHSSSGQPLNQTSFWKASFSNLIYIITLF